MSETTNLKLKKHDNPETNTEKFDIENYLNENWDKIDKNVGEVNTNISNINSKNKEQDTNIEQLQENTETSNNKIAELEKELKEAQEDFYQNSIRGQASGEYIHVEDSSNCRSIIGIGGNHEQETRSGKNLSKIEKISTINGGYINSTCGILATIEAGKTYTISFNCSNKHSGTNAIYVRVLNENTYEGQAALNYNSGNRISKTFVASKSGELSLSASLGTDFKDILYDIQLEEGSTATKYEQYGASPSPDYKSEIKSVGSNVNEFDIAAVKDGFLNEKTGEIISNNSWKCSDFIEILNKTYTFGWESSSDYFQVTVCYYDENKKFISGKSCGLRGTFNNTFEVVSNAKYMKIAYSVSVSGKVVTREKIKLEKGKVATPYSKYGQGCVKVTKCNNNLFNKNDIVNKAYINSSGEIVSNDGQNYTNYISVVSNAMYTIHAENPLGAVTAICFYDTNKKFLSGSTYNNVKSMSFKTPSNCDFVRASVSNINLETLQIEEGPATTYEEHEEQSYIMPVQKEMLQGDYFDFDNEKEEHKWIKLIFDGTENWLQSGNTYPTFYFSPCDISSKFAVPENAKGLCNYFKQIGSIWEQDVMAFDIANITTTHSDFRFCLGSNSTITTLEEWKNKLSEMYNSGQPLVLYFQLRTPIRQKFTDEQKAVAKELNNARTYKNVTNITTDSKAILSLDYVKDQETQNQKMQNEIDEIKQLLSTTQTSAMLLDNLQKEVESEVE